MIDNLVDRVSKNGYLLLNVGPKPDGTIPEEARELLLEVGKWLEINGEAIYGTSPWLIASEGPTNLGKASDIGFNESNVVYTSKDIRFTVKGDVLYATFLAWPGEEAIIHTLRIEGDENDDDEDDNEDEFVPLAGKTFTIEEYTWVFKEDSKLRVSGGLAGEGTDGEYEQEGQEVFIEVGGFELEGTYDGEKFEIEEDGAPRYPGFYPEEIKRITMLGDGRKLDWEITREGLVIETPDKKPCKDAYVFKIERHHHPPID